MVRGSNFIFLPDIILFMYFIWRESIVNKYLMVFDFISDGGNINQEHNVTAYLFLSSGKHI